MCPVGLLAVQVLIGLRVSHWIREASSRAPSVIFFFNRVPPDGCLRNSSSSSLAKRMTATVHGSIYLEGESAGAAVLARQIQEPCLGNRLASLSLRRLHMDARHVDALASGMRVCSCLMRLELIVCGIDNQGCGPQPPLAFFQHRPALDLGVMNAFGPFRLSWCDGSAVIFFGCD